MESRALHPDKGRGTGDIAAEAGDLRQQVFALKDLARIEVDDPTVLLESLNIAEAETTKLRDNLKAILTAALVR